MSRYPPLTQEKEFKVTNLVELMQETYDFLPPQLTELERLIPISEAQKASTPHNPLRQYCYCFLVAREWDLSKAFEMMQLTISYRAEHKLDGQLVFPAAMPCKGWDEAAIREAFTNEGGNEVEAVEPRPTDQRLDCLCACIAPYLSYGFHKWDKMGQPVLYLMIGKVDEPGLLEALKHMATVGQSAESVLWEVVSHILSVGECLQTYQQMQYNAGKLKVDAADGLIRSTTLVIDLKGLTYKMLWKPALDLFMNTLKEIFQYYPQCIYRILLVNSPAMVMFAYKTIRGVLPSGVQKKVVIANVKDTPETLKKHVVEDCLPDFYEGSCHCEGGCIDGFDPNASEDEVAAARRGVGAASTCAGGACGGGEDAECYNPARSAELVAKEDIVLKAGRHHKHVFHMKEGEKVAWEFACSNGHNVAFTKYFVPHVKAANTKCTSLQMNQLQVFLVSTENPSEGTGEYTAAADGMLVLVWDNKQSWFTAKHLQMKVFKP